MHPGRGGKTINVSGRISAIHASYVTATVTKSRRNGSQEVSEFGLPAQGWAYSSVLVFDDDDVLVQSCAPPNVNPLPPAASSAAPPPTHAADNAEKQRLQLLNEQRQAATAGQEQRDLLFRFMQEMQADAVQQRKMLLDAQAAAEARAELQRKTMLDDAAAAAKAAKLERADMMNTIKALSQGISASQASATASGSTKHRARSHSSSDSSSDDDGAATDVDDSTSCARAITEWGKRCCNTPSDKRHLVPWYLAVGAPEATTSAFITRWGRKLDVPADTGPRDTVECMALESIIGDLQRALTASDAHVARYAAMRSLQTAMQMAQRAQMRVEGATAEAMTAFDESLAVNDRKMRRRAVDHQHLETLAAQAKRKHGRKRPGANDRRDRRDRRDRASSAPREATKDAQTAKPKST